MRSSDGGLSWADIQSNPRVCDDVDLIAPAASDAGTAYFSRNITHLYKTTDGGVTLSEVQTGGQQWSYIEALAVDPRDPSIVLIGTLTDQAQILRSADGGQTWAVSALGRHEDSHVQVITFDPGGSGLVFANAGGRLWKSQDHGATWLPLPSFDARRFIYDLAEFLEVDPQSPSVLYLAPALDVGLYGSKDGGNTWARIGSSVEQFQALWIDPARSSHLVAGTVAGVIESQDSGITWVDSSAGLTALKVLSIVEDSAQPVTLYAATNGGIFRTQDSGLNWSRTALIEPYCIAVLAPPNNRVVVGTLNNGIWLSSDRGATWRAATSQVSGGVISLAVDPGGSSTVLAGTLNGLIISTDGGDTWGPVAQVTGNASVLAGSRPGEFFGFNRDSTTSVSVTSDNGKSWDTIGLNPPADLVYPKVAGIDTSATPVVIYLTAFDGSTRWFLKSPDAGLTWSLRVPSPCGNDNPSAFVVDPRNHDRLVVGCPGLVGVAQSLDGGKTFSWIGLQGQWIETLTLTAGGSLYAGTNWNSIFRYEPPRPRRRLMRTH
jgi:photosystem II stability/assembly factor-like uncharacterized protein